MTLDKLVTQITELFPDANIEEDNDGQIVIYTGLEADARGDLRRFEGVIEYPDNESNCQYHDKG